MGGVGEVHCSSYPAWLSRARAIEMRVNGGLIPGDQHLVFLRLRGRSHGVSSRHHQGDTQAVWLVVITLSPPNARHQWHLRSIMAFQIWRASS